jgi:transposase
MKLTKQDEALLEHCLKNNWTNEDIIKLFLSSNRGSRTSIYIRIGRFRRTGTVFPKVGGRPLKLDPQHREFILDVLAEKPGCGVKELQAEIMGKFSLYVAEATIKRLFKNEEFLEQRAARRAGVVESGLRRERSKVS